MDCDHISSEPHLLNHLATITHCTYLSDLHQPHKWFDVQAAVVHCPAGAYSHREWVDAVAYITKQRPAVSTSEEARRFLLQWDGLSFHSRA